MGVLGVFKILHGDEMHLLGYAKMLGDPSFDDARVALRVTRRIFNTVKETSDALERDIASRAAQ